MEKYDFENIRIIKNGDDFSFMVPNIEMNDKFLGVTMDLDVINFIETQITENNGSKTIGYNSLNNDFKINVTIGANHKLTYSYYSNNHANNLVAAPCGQAVMNCITHIYSEMGWTSVAAWVGTAFAPEISIAVAAGCALKHCK